jgi:hypothetical protein
MNVAAACFWITVAAAGVGMPQGPELEPTGLIDNINDIT